MQSGLGEDINLVTSPLLLVFILKNIARRKVKNTTVELSVSVTCSWKQLLCIEQVQLG